MRNLNSQKGIINGTRMKAPGMVTGYWHVNKVAQKLPRSVISHGQLHVALISRTISFDTARIFITETENKFNVSDNNIHRGSVGFKETLKKFIFI